jgi:hypothetical protein
MNSLQPMVPDFPGMSWMKGMENHYIHQTAGAVMVLAMHTGDPTAALQSQDRARAPAGDVGVRQGEDTRHHLYQQME